MEWLLDLIADAYAPLAARGALIDGLPVPGSPRDDRATVALAA